MMIRKKKKYWWLAFCACLLGLFLERSDALAYMIKPDVHVGFVCIDGLSVRLSDGGKPTWKDTPFVLDLKQCRPPGIPEGLPGKFVLSSLTEDGKSAVVVIDLKQSPRHGVDTIADFLLKRGFKYTPASKEVRDRNQLIPVAELTRDGQILFVLGAPTADVDNSRISIISLEEDKKRRSLK